MSMLVPPQMMNTMVSGLYSVDGALPGAGSMPAAGAAFTEALLADPVRRYMLPVFSDRHPTGRATPTPAVTRCTSTTCGSPRG